MGIDSWIALVAVVLTLFTVAGTYFSSRLKGAKEEGKSNIILINIDTKLKDITDANLRQEGRLSAAENRITAVEQSDKSAHLRIDELRDDIKQIKEK